MYRTGAHMMKKEEKGCSTYLEKASDWLEGETDSNPSIAL